MGRVPESHLGGGAPDGGNDEDRRTVGIEDSNITHGQGDRGHGQQDDMDGAARPHGRVAAAAADTRTAQGSGSRTAHARGRSGLTWIGGHRRAGPRGGPGSTRTSVHGCLRASGRYRERCRSTAGTAVGRASSRLEEKEEGRITDVRTGQKGRTPGGCAPSACPARLGRLGRDGPPHRCRRVAGPRGCPVRAARPGLRTGAEQEGGVLACRSRAASRRRAAGAADPPAVGRCRS